MHAPRTFNLWLKQLRADRDLTQEALAEQVGCSVDAVRAFESGRRRPSRAMSERLADVLALPSAEHDTFVQLARAPEPAVEPPSVSPEPSAAATTQTQRRQTHALPAAFNILIGREHELAELARKIGDPQCRLLTLVGAGGVGKTSLALQLATNLREHFADGAVWVALEELSTADQVIPAIGDAIGLQLQGDSAAQGQLLDNVRDQELLLVLDNVEHLLDAVNVFSTILAAAPRVKILATSRARLRLRSEWAVELGGLALPHVQTGTEVARSAAVMLFLERARQVDHRWTLTPGNQAQVVQICRLLDGTPLGIELAASWVHALAAAEIAAELERALDLPESAVRDLPARHRSLRAVFDHSWQLLTPTEQGVLCRLAIFRGGWEREAAVAVAQATLPLLAGLVDKSLVRHAKTGRYEMHPLIRRFAADRLHEQPAWAAETRQHHASYYVQWLAVREQPVLAAISDNTVMAEIQGELDNVLFAWEQLIVQPQALLFQQALPCFAYFLEMRCRFHEGSMLFERAARALVQADSTPSSLEQGVYGQLLSYAGWFTGRGGDNVRAQGLLQQSLAVLAAHDDPAARYRPLFGLGVITLDVGNYAEAEQLLRASLAVARSGQNTHGIAYSLTLLGEVTHAQGQLQVARGTLEEALLIWRVVEDGKVPCLNRLGAVLVDLGEYTLAQALLQESVHISSNRDDPEGLAAALVVLGKAALLQGQGAEAFYLLHESIGVFREIGAYERLAKALVVLAWAYHAEADWGAARTTFAEAYRIVQPLQFVPIMLNVLYGLVNLLIQVNALDRALPLLKYMLAQPATEGLTRADAAQLCATIEGRFPAALVSALAAALHDEPLETVVEGVLNDLSQLQYSHAHTPL